MTNEELVRRYYGGDERALEELYRRNLGLIRRIARETAREFNCLHMDQVMIIRTTLSKLVMCSDLSFLLKMYYSKQRQGQFLSLPLLIFFAMMIKMGTL